MPVVLLRIEFVRWELSEGRHPLFGWFSRT